MRLPIAFDPIEVGEVDCFAFDFTPDVGPGVIVATHWTCTLAPFQTGLDETPQLRIRSAKPAGIIQVRSPVDGSLQTRTGAFSTAVVGGMPASAVGSTYILEATVTLSDGRVLKLNSTVLCSAPVQ